MQTLVVMALKVESQGLFEKAGYQVFYCGVGAVKATHNMTKWLQQHKPARVLNLGTAGSHRFKAGSLVECTSFVQRQPHDFLKMPTQILKCPPITTLPEVVCGTGDFIETGVPVTPCDVFDMESYALAFTCQKMNTPFHSIKYVTDSSDANLVSDWQNNLGKAAETLLQQLRDLKLESQ
jgi:adenosylhomocysteine nucleosidase